jgi:hypothetical protein
MREIVVEAVFNDPYDGAIRVLGDAQRSGFELLSLALAARASGIASATMPLRVPISFDAQLAAARLARHPAVQQVDVRADTAKALRGHSQAMAA